MNEIKNIQPFHILIYKRWINHNLKCNIPFNVSLQKYFFTMGENIKSKSFYEINFSLLKVKKKPYMCIV